MSDLPTGTVTFLFSDIEGSTRLLQSLGDRYPGVLGEHAAIFRSAIAEADGVEVSTEGDSFFVVFRTPSQAIAAAAQIQRDLAQHPWPEPLRVRMGIHTGEGVLGGDNYVGLDVHRAARIMAAGHGGQVLVSEPTRALVEQALPAGVTLRDMGDHRLKDLASREHLYQLVAGGLPSEFPPLRSLDARPNNLPVQLTSFVGRADEIAAVTALVREHRLVTLTGPGGTGKTRLSLQVAAELLPEFRDGVFFVELASLTDATLVATSIAEALAIPEEPDRPAIETLKRYLAERELLLVLDNFEQVADAAPAVEDLLRAAPRLRGLVTSRTILRLYGEQEYPVPPLVLPDPANLPSLTALSQYAAVRLFIDRAMAVRPGFQITNENAPAVAEITARLDGLPLAIELAASRIKLLPPQAILGRLEKRLPLLEAAARNLPERQRTLRGAIEWSYDLLDEAERRLFLRLSVFMGGWDIEGAEAVCAGDDADLDVFRGLASLVDNSLVRQRDTAEPEPRFEMLETIREYAAGGLEASGEVDELRARHAHHFLALSERGEQHFTAEDQVAWLRRFELEHDNVRAALRWAIDSDRAQVGMRIGAAIWRFWHQRGHLREGRRWLEELLSLASAAPRDAVRARALAAFGSLAYWQNDYAVTKPAYEESAEIFGEIGDRRGLAEALHNLAFLPLLFEEDWPAARALFERSLEEARASGWEEGVANNVSMLAFGSMQEGDYDDALEKEREATDLFRKLGNRFATAEGVLGQSWALREKGDLEAATALIREPMEIFVEAGNPSGIAIVLNAYAAIATSAGDHEKALRLAGAADAIRDHIGGGAPPQIAQFPDYRAEAERAGLDPAAIEEAWRRGYAVTMEEAIASVLDDTERAER